MSSSALGDAQCWLGAHGELVVPPCPEDKEHAMKVWCNTSPKPSLTGLKGRVSYLLLVPAFSF